MWINDEFYNELVKVLSGFSQHKVDFNEERFDIFESEKYNKLTKLLKEIKDNTKAQINTNIKIMTSLENGTYEVIDEDEIKDNDFKVFYEKYNLLVNHHDRISRHIHRVKQSIAGNGKIDSRLDVDEVCGKWFDVITNVNLILDSLATPIEEIAAVIKNVAMGSLDTKMQLKFDNFEIKGDFLNLATTINTMVEQLRSFSSEVTRVAKEVGTEGVLGGQAKVEGVSGTWLELTNNVNGMAGNLTTQVRNIAEVTAAVAKGDLTKKITIDAKGEVFQLKSTINTMVEQLSAFASEVTRVSKEVGTEGVLGGQAKVERLSGTWLELTNNVNGMADNLTSQVRNIAEVTTAVAKGDLSQKITVDARGEVLELKNTINVMVDQLNSFSSEVTRVAKEVGTEGILGGQAKVEGVSGTWLELTNNVNGMAGNLTTQVRNIAEVTAAVAKGDLTKKITIDAKGEVFQLKSTINTMVEQLSAFASEVTRVSKEVGTEGVLGGQAKVERLSGTWLELTNNVNGMADNLTSQVRNIAEVTTAVAKGDLSQKITVDARGEVLELKNTINVMVDQLNSFSSEVTRVAKEVGTDGLLGGQAKVERISGTWLDLTNNVNGMASNLTAQVRNIAVVTTAVAKGDFTQKITVEAKGEVLELQDTINTMVDEIVLANEEKDKRANELTLANEEKDKRAEELILANELKEKKANELVLANKELAFENEEKDKRADELTLANELKEEKANALVLANKKLGFENEEKDKRADEWILANEEKDKRADELILANEEKVKRADELMIANKELAFQNEENKNQNWIKDGVYLLNAKVLNNDTLVEQIETSINELSRYVNAGMGALYIYDSENDLLTLEGSYAFTKRANVSNVFKVGEGIVGQVAYEKKPILLTNVPDEFTIQSGTTTAKALNIYTYPLIFKEELIAVAEVASYEKFNATILEYIDSALVALAGALFTSIQATATSNLLVQSQAQSQELVEQSQQLTSQNEKLEEQRESMDLQQQELQVKNSDLEVAQVEVNKRAQDLEDANRYKSEFLANMSHELRTPLNSMLLLSNSLSKVKEIETKKLNKQAETIYDAGSSLLNLINDILDLSKIEAKLMTFNIEEIHISSILHDLKALFKPQSDDKNIQLESIIDKNVLRTFSSDKIKLTQVLRNFLSNAVKFTGEGGRISIEVTPNNEGDKILRPIVISVVDNGIGIEKDKMSLVFEAFKQADGGTSRKYGGTGLGLSISKELAVLLGGRISMKSTIGEGSSFSIYLPLEIDTGSIDESLVEHIQYENIPKSVREIEREISIVDDREKLNKQDVVILVVEDDAVFANMILEEIHKLGHKAIVACDGSTAISMAKEYVPTAIILDILLPIVNGMEVLRILKSDINTRHIPVNILSCTESNNIAKKLGAFDFITKPIQENELANLITGLVDFVKDKQKRILIIEDDQVQAEYLDALLTDKYISVKSVGTAKQGLKEALSHKYDCAIVDLGLLGMNGFTLFSLLEEESIKIPIIIYTARDLTDAEWIEIRKHSDSVVLKTATSDVRLIEEVSLFLHSEKISLNAEKQQLLTQAMDTDLLLEGKKLLIVDDDIRNIYALSSVLEGKGLDITSAQNGKEALELLQNSENKFDVVLMDIMMPVMDGYEAMREIRKDNRVSNIPIIALTAKAQAEDKQLCIDSGANDYMAKPVDHEQLLSLLKVWLARNNANEI
jgi:CheY-like chemotaxis protein/signal transduction histidine kinase/HAMP domain-containing protein